MVTVDSKGRIVLPSEVRDRLGLRPGSEVVVGTEDGRIVVEPEDRPEQIIRDLEELIDEAADNRGRRGEATGTGGEPVRDDSIAETQREIIRRGARSGLDDRDDIE